MDDPEGRRKILVMAGILFGILILISYVHGETFSLTYSSSTGPGQSTWNHHGGAGWNFNGTDNGFPGTWYISTQMEQAASSFQSWNFASQYFDEGTYTTSNTGTIKFYNNSVRNAASYLGEGTLTYTYLGSSTYGAVQLVMTHPLPSGTNFYPVANTMYTTVSNANLAGTGSTYTGESYSGNFMFPSNPVGLPEGPVTGASYGYDYYLLGGDWRVDYNSTYVGGVSTYTLTPVSSSYRYWSVKASGAISAPLSAFTGNSITNFTIGRAQVFVQDPFYNSTDFSFWVGGVPNYTLTMTPANISALGSSQATVFSSTTSFEEVNGFAYTCSPGTCSYNGQEQPAFYYVNGAWKQFNSATQAFDIAYSGTPSSIPLTFDTSGDIVVRADLSKYTDAPVSLTKTVHVGVIGATNSTTTLKINVRGAETNSLISGSTIYIKNTGSGVWTNKSSTTGSETFPINLNEYYSWTASAPTYVLPNNLMTGKFTSAAETDVVLYRNGTLNNVGNVSFQVWVMDTSTNKGLAGTNVRVGGTVGSSGSGDQKTTGESGMVQFEALPSTDYEVQAAKEGYDGTSEVYHTNVAGDVAGRTVLQLSPIYVTPAPTDPNGNPITTQQTVDPNPCTSDNPAGCDAKQTDAANFWINNLSLLGPFFLLLIFVGGIKLIGRK